MLISELFDQPRIYFAIVIVVMVSVVLHELGHALAATWEGDPTPRAMGHLTWNPMKHMGGLAIAMLVIAGITFGRTPVQPRNFRHGRWGSALVAFAGPAVNLFLAAVAAVSCAAIQRLRGGLDLAVTGDLYLVMTLHMNVVLFLLNMIPLPPLDGFTVADSTFDLGSVGRFLTSAVPYTLFAAIFIANSRHFDVVERAVREAIQSAAAIPVSFLGT